MTVVLNSRQLDFRFLIIDLQNVPNFFRIVQKRGLDYISACCKIVLTIFQSNTKLSLALKKFQSVLKKPAVQLVEKSKGYRMIPNGDQYILVAPAYQWLSGFAIVIFKLHSPWP